MGKGVFGRNVAVGCDYEKIGAGMRVCRTTLFLRVFIMLIRKIKIRAEMKPVKSMMH
jgi:hypothetical protein